MRDKLNKSENENTYILEVLSWFSLEDTYDDLNWISQYYFKKEMEEFLNKHSDKSFFKEEQDSFRENFRDIMLKYYKHSALNIRDSLVPSINVINKCLKHFDYPFILESSRETSGEKRTYWCLKKLTDNDTPKSNDKDCPDEISTAEEPADIASNVSVNNISAVDE